MATPDSTDFWPQPAPPPPEPLSFLSPAQMMQLERQGCSSDDWSLVTIDPGLDLRHIHHTHFGGRVVINLGAKIRNVSGGIFNCRVGRNATIENVTRIQFEPEAPCGIGIQISVLDETGSRPIVAYPGLSAQAATLMARNPAWLENNIKPTLQEFLDSRAVPHEIGDGATVRDCGRIINVSIGPRVTIEGAAYLKNGVIINNTTTSRSLAYVGSGVDAENFIIEDGKVDSGAVLRNCYVGQGAYIEKGFTAHDSVFFANCTFENGEACALLAGPYTVSMHKASLLIGCQTSFLNAGSNTNQSNHMYKLGPVHWGVLERGVKTSSGSYIMLGAKIAPFSLVMGQHKTHPDSSAFPFSYLFGDQRGATVVVPAAMLRSCGMLRDEKKWPTRDRRLRRKLPFHDRIIFNVLNPYTVDLMLDALQAINKLLEGKTCDDLLYRHNGMKMSRASLERAKTLYHNAICKYLYDTLPGGKFPPPEDKNPQKWVDVGGQIVPRKVLKAAFESESIEECEKIFSRAFVQYKAEEIKWISRRFGPEWRNEPAIAQGARRFTKDINSDRDEYLSMLSKENIMLAL